MTIPDLIPYPKIYKISETNEINNLLCFVIEKYCYDGISLIIVREKDTLAMQLSDFNGKQLNDYKSSNVDIIMSNYSGKIVEIMRYTRISQAQYYFSCSKNNDPILVDIRVSLFKLCSPGFINDIFGKIGVPQQKICGKPIILNQDNLKMVENKKGDYSHGDFILKPSVFKTIIKGKDVVPLYCEM